MGNCEAFSHLARRDERVERAPRLRSNAARGENDRSPQGHPKAIPAKPQAFTIQQTFISHCRIFQGSPKGLGKITRHAGAVYPLEAYGFLIGEPASTRIICALPVSKTTRWYEFSDRFAVIDSALAMAKTVSMSFGLDIMDVYHSFFGFLDTSPLYDVPESFRQGIVCIKNVSGGDLDLCPYQFYIVGVNTSAVKIRLSNAPNYNPRRIHSLWKSHWGEIDYDNGYSSHLTTEQTDAEEHG